MKAGSGFRVQSSGLKNAIILTGDPEFRNAEKLVKIDWLTS
jgi:hypothetical protein